MESNEDASTHKPKFSRTDKIVYFTWFASVIGWGLYQIIFT